MPLVKFIRFPVRRFYQDTNRVVSAGSRLGSVQWVLSRPLYRFQQFDFSKLDQRNRLQALQLELKQWSPFAESGYFIGWNAGIAYVWCWDREKVDRALGAHQLKPNRVRIIPETLLGKAAQDGLQLLQCREGYEGQVWAGGNLTHSRWWPSRPADNEWLQFQRDAGIHSEAQQLSAPAAVADSPSAEPWLASGGNRTKADVYEQVALVCCVVPLACFSLWYGINIYKLSSRTAAYQSLAADIAPRVEPILQARVKTLDYLVRYKSLSQIRHYPEQVLLMAKVAESLPKDNSYVSSWDFESGILKISINQANETASSELIGRMKATGLFGEVSARSGKVPKLLDMQLDVLRANN